MSIFQDEPRTKLTYDDYVLLPDDGNQHEIINGRHYMNAAPNPRHQTISRLIQFQLMEQIEMPGHGQVFDAPTDVQFDDFNVVQPDILVVSKQNDIITDTRIRGVPELVVEVLSPSTRDRDLQLKMQLYEQSGVGEYWIVDPDRQTVLSHRLGEAGKYPEPSSHAVEIVFTGIECNATIDLTKVWERIN